MPRKDSFPKKNPLMSCYTRFMLSLFAGFHSVFFFQNANMPLMGKKLNSCLQMVAVSLRRVCLQGEMRSERVTGPRRTGWGKGNKNQTSRFYQREATGFDFSWERQKYDTYYVLRWCFRVLQILSWSLQEFKWLDQDHTANKEQSWDLNSMMLPPNPFPLYIKLPILASQIPPWVTTSELALSHPLASHCVYKLFTLICIPYLPTTSNAVMRIKYVIFFSP